MVWLVEFAYTQAFNISILCVIRSAQYDFCGSSTQCTVDGPMGERVAGHSAAQIQLWMSSLPQHHTQRPQRPSRHCTVGPTWLACFFNDLEVWYSI